ncbi:MAG: transposase [Chloroflexota bacterium]
MSKQRRQYSSAYKFKLALEAAKGSKTLAQLSSDTGVHPNQLSQWKAQLLDGGAHLYQRNPAQSVRELQQPAAALYEQIGRLKMELEWLKKKCPESPAAQRALLAPNHPALSLRRQCELLGLARATYYYQPAGESALNLRLLRLLAEQYLKTPFYGWPKLTA